MTMHGSTFEYLKPTEKQLDTMSTVRAAFRDFADTLNSALPEGPDKTHVLRLLRAASMWANVSITRNADGAPRE